MGFVDKMNAAAEKATAQRELHKYDGSYEKVQLVGDKLTIGRNEWPVAECSASVDHGQNLKPRFTATRVILTGPFSPLFKKDRNKVYLMVETPGEPYLVEVKAKKETEVRKFAMRVENAARHHAAE